MKKYTLSLILIVLVVLSLQIYNETEVTTTMHSLMNSKSENIIFNKDLLSLAKIENKNSQFSDESQATLSSKKESRHLASTDNRQELNSIISRTKEIDSLSEDSKESPQAILDWSADIGFMMLQAFDDNQYADKVFRDLQECSENEHLEMVFRAICAANLKRLSEKRSDAFAQKYSAVQNHFHDDIKKFLEEAYTEF